METPREIEKLELVPGAEGKLVLLRNKEGRTEVARKGQRPLRPLKLREASSGFFLATGAAPPCRATSEAGLVPGCGPAGVPGHC